jgi:hypothetical protein
MRATTLALLAVLLLPAIAAAQAEDRQRAPTAEAANAADPCATAMDRSRGPRAGWPGFDARLPMPTGATSFTGIAPATRDPSRENLQAPSPNDLSYEDCRRRMGPR